MSALLEPEEDTLIWSAWVLFKELSLTVLILHTNTISCLYFQKDNRMLNLNRFVHVKSFDADQARLSVIS